MLHQYRITAMPAYRLEETLALVRRVFMEFQAPEYTLEGITTFMRFIDVGSIRAKIHAAELALWICTDGDTVVGMIAMEPRGHIALLFVDAKHHNKGIARSLLRTAMTAPNAGQWPCLTVNASHYALEAYQRLGFEVSGPEQTVTGIRFVPMLSRFPAQASTPPSASILAAFALLF